MATWPTSLNLDVSKDDYSETFGNTSIRTQMGVGFAKTRRRYTTAVKNLDVVYRFDDTQLNTFISFYENDIASGASVFTYTHPRTGASIDVRLREPLEPFIPFGQDMHEVMLKLEIRP